MKHYRVNADSYEILAFYLNQEQEFNDDAAAIRGREIYDGDLPTRGQLIQVYWDVLKRDEPVYIVYSYDTPIAWLSKDNVWVVPPEPNTNTSRKHAAKVRYALQQCTTDERLLFI